MALFDTLAYARRLRGARISDSHARAHSEALHGAMREGVATSGDLARVEGELRLLRWLIVLGLGWTTFCMTFLTFFLVFFG